MQDGVLGRLGGERGFLYPARGALCFLQFTLRPVEQEHLKFVILQPFA